MIAAKAVHPSLASACSIATRKENPILFLEPHQSHSFSRLVLSSSCGTKTSSASRCVRAVMSAEPQRRLPLEWSGGSGEALIFSSTDDLSRGLAEVVVKASEDAIKRHSAFSLVLSGGSLINFLSLLASEDFRSQCEWAKWHVFWADERVVPLAHPDSNFGGANAAFLAKLPIPPSQVHAIDESQPSAAEAAKAYAATVDECVASRHVDKGASPFPSFDLVLLGIGPDGHVASLFPGHPLLDEASLWVAPIHDSPKPPPQRITLTLPVLNAAHCVAVVAAGGSKAPVVKRSAPTAAREEEGGEALPAGMVRPSHGRLLWILDESAAKDL